MAAIVQAEKEQKEKDRFEELQAKRLADAKLEEANRRAKADAKIEELLSKVVILE